jgi:Tfp pilus assembly protein PilF
MPRAREELRRNQPKPEHGLVLADRGYEALRNDDLKTARDYLIKALQIDEHNPYALINLGVVYQKEGDYPRAIEMYRKVIETGTEATAMTPADYHGEDLSLVTIARQNIEFVEQLMQK